MEPPPPERTLSKKTRQQLRRAFAAFDADDSGWISISELSGALRRCGMYVGDVQLRKMFDEADEDRSGGIDLSEFEALVERLMAPSRLFGTAGDGAKLIPPPASGSATATVFSALSNGSTGYMAARELPHALRLLGIHPEEPPIVKAIADASTASRGVLGRKAFSVLVHRLLCRDFISTAATAPSDAPSPTSPKRAPSRQRTSLDDAPEVVDEPDPRRRLARLFVLCESQQEGSIAARDIPKLLWQARIIRDASLIPALTPKPQHAAARVPFERLLAIAFGEPTADERDERGNIERDAADRGERPTSASSVAVALPPMQLNVRELSLAPWVLSHIEVHTLCVIVRAALRTAAADGVSADMLPVVSRSASMRKQPAPMALELDVLLPAGTASLHLELVHESMHGSAAVLARAELDLIQLYDGADYPLPYELPLFDARTVQAGTLELVATRLADAAPPTPALAPRSSTAAGWRSGEQPELALSTSATSAQELAALESEVATLRARAADFQRQRDMLSVQLRAEQRIRSHLPCGGNGRIGHRSPAATSGHDWRFAVAESLGRALGNLKRRSWGHSEGGASELAAVLEHSFIELAEHARTDEPRVDGRPSNGGSLASTTLV